MTLKIVYFFRISITIKAKAILAYAPALNKIKAYPLSFQRLPASGIYKAVYKQVKPYAHQGGGVAVLL
jgi:hypothetical protein